MSFFWLPENVAFFLPCLFQSINQHFNYWKKLKKNIHPWLILSKQLLCSLFHLLLAETIAQCSWYLLWLMNFKRDKKYYGMIRAFILLYTWIFTYLSHCDPHTQWWALPHSSNYRTAVGQIKWPTTQQWQKADALCLQENKTRILPSYSMLLHYLPKYKWKFWTWITTYGSTLGCNSSFLEPGHTFRLLKMVPAD